MPNDSEQIYQDWFKKAEEDELSIMAILKEGGAPSTACFLSQQMAEKYLKGLLVFYKKRFPKMHDLLKLKDLLLEKVSGMEELQDELKLLNRYYIETRYPGDYPEFTLKEAEKAFVSAKIIKNFVLAQIKKPK